jgi:hypothetical protein
MASRGVQSKLLKIMFKLPNWVFEWMAVGMTTMLFAALMLGMLAAFMDV